MSPLSTASTLSTAVVRRSSVATVLLTLTLGASAGLLACSDRRSVAEAVGQPWLVTIYYTAVESFHRDDPVEVRGCPGLECANGDDQIGRYPRSFVTAVKDEGSGRITSGEHAGEYLNWSHDVGYWLDSEPRDAHGRPLEPYRSAATDELPDGTRLVLVDCGRLESGRPVPPEVCQKLRGGQWEIRDRFTPGVSGSQHIDLYIGEEPAADFTASGDLYVTLHEATFKPGE